MYKDLDDCFKWSACAPYKDLLYTLSTRKYISDEILCASRTTCLPSTNLTVVHRSEFAPNDDKYSNY